MCKKLQKDIWISHPLISHRKHQTSTTLSHHLWNNDLNEDPDLKWPIIDRTPSYTIGNRYCDLSLTEKIHILKNIDNPQYLNKRTELAQRCRHKAKFHLINLKPPWTCHERERGRGCLSGWGASVFGAQKSTQGEATRNRCFQSAKSQAGSSVIPRKVGGRWNITSVSTKVCKPY